MDPFWQIEEARFEGLWQAQRQSAAAQPVGPETGAPFFAQIEHVLGAETAPDSEFFIDNWTVGIAAASENFRRRQEQLKTRAQEMPAWNTSSFTPWFVEKTETSAAAAWPIREARPNERSIADERSCAHLRWVDNEQENNEQAPEEFKIDNPPTRESACRVLGVAATSTQQQIRGAYRKMASLYHPDRVAQSEAREQKLAGDRMASINEAYRLLRKDLAGPWRPFYVS